MHAAINALSITNQSGTGRYVWGLVDGFSKQAFNDLELTVLIPAGFALPKDWWQISGLRFFAIPVNGVASRIIWEQAAMPRLLKKLKVELLHSPSFICPVRGSNSITHIVTVHDLAFLKFPQTITNAARVYYKSLIPPSIRRAHTVITDSKTVAEELRESFLASHSSVEKTVIPIALGVDRERFHPSPCGDEEVLERYGILSPYFLFVGTQEPRKNLALIYQAYSDAREHGLRAGLVIAGRAGWMENDSWFEASGVVKLGHVPDAHLPALYRQAQALLAPSMYEGFDLPIAEARACGTAVIASDIPVHREVAGEAAQFAGVDSVSGWSCLMRETLNQPQPIEASWVRDWSKVALETCGVYRQAHEQRGEQ